MCKNAKYEVNQKLKIAVLAAIVDILQRPTEMKHSVPKTLFRGIQIFTNVIYSYIEIGKILNAKRQCQHNM